MPTPAVAGLNWPPLTPGPLYVPPAGEPPVNANAAVFIHTLLKAVSVAVGVSVTLIVLCAILVQLLEFV